jgi:hypothetical protein
MGRPNFDDYVDVAERIRTFYEKHPTGTLCERREPQVMEIGGQPFIVYYAAAYRTPDDPCPGHGTAWEPVPGPTSFTKDSELMNAETAAWGRAIASLGFEVRRIATQQDMAARGHGQQQAPGTIPAERTKAIAALFRQAGTTHQELGNQLTAVGVQNVNSDDLESVVAGVAALTPEQATKVEAWLQTVIEGGPAPAADTTDTKEAAPA